MVFGAWATKKDGGVWVGFVQLADAVEAVRWTRAVGCPRAFKLDTFR